MRRPERFTMQWHLTGRCNLSCSHCYQENNPDASEFDFHNLVKVLEGYVELVRYWNLPRDRCRINLTGGEPLLFRDLFRLLELFYKYDNLFRWGILSNGSLINNDIARRIKGLGIYAFQVSLEGNRLHNDMIRGKGSFDRTIEAIETLLDAGILVAVSLTLTKSNMDDIPGLVKNLYNKGIRYLGVRRFIPLGVGGELKEVMLSTSELKSFYSKVIEANKSFSLQGKEFKIDIGCESAIANGLLTDDNTSQKRMCSVTEGSVLTVMPNGDVYPCRRLPIKIGNVAEKDLRSIYEESQLLTEVSDPELFDIRCRKCSHFTQCHGGALCVNYAISGDIFTKDVQCWR